MIYTRLKLTALFVLLHAWLRFSVTHAILTPRQQLTFPPANGPCRQNIGLAPLQCSDTACIDVPASGLCNIQDSSGPSQSLRY